MLVEGATRIRCRIHAPALLAALCLSYLWLHFLTAIESETREADCHFGPFLCVCFTQGWLTCWKPGPELFPNFKRLFMCLCCVPLWRKDSFSCLPWPQLRKWVSYVPCGFTSATCWFLVTEPPFASRKIKRCFRLKIIQLEAFLFLHPMWTGRRNDICYAQLVRCHFMLNAQSPSDSLNSCLCALVMKWLVRLYPRCALLDGLVSVSLISMQEEILNLISAPCACSMAVLTSLA